MPYLSGEVIYSLRCSLLREGNPNMNNNSLKTALPIDYFLVVERAKPFDIYSDCSSIANFGDKNIREYSMNVRRVCMILCNVAESFYKENKEKFHFNYKIIDWYEMTNHLPPIDVEKFLVN